MTRCEKKANIYRMIAFRCDSSFLIGSGHLSRCLALAGQLKSLGLSSIFILKDLAGLNTEVLERAGVEFRIIPQDTDLDAELQMLAALRPDWVIVDHYQIDINWEQRAAKFAKIFVIDDLADRQHYCDVLLDQNFRLNYSGLYENLVPSGCRVFLGPRYSLLPAHYERSSGPRIFSGNLQRQILVFFGGADPTGEILKFKQALAGFNGFCHYTLVATQNHRFVEELKKLQNTNNCTLLLSPSNWTELLKNSDYFFGSCGSVTWERFYFGLPGDVITVAANQEKIAADLQGAGLCRLYGRAKQVNYSEILPEIEKSANDVSELQKTSEKLKALTDRFPREVLGQIFGGHGVNP